MLDMFRDFSLGQYIHGDSILHHLDGRIKLISLSIIILTIFMIKYPLHYLLLFIFIFILVILSGLKFSYFMKSLKAIAFLLIAVSLFNLFFIKEGKVLIHLLWFSITDKALLQTSIVLSRLILLIMSSSLVTLTTSPVDLTYAIEKLLTPFKKVGFPAHEFSLMMTISLRFIPILGRELDKIIKAHLARGINPSKGSLKSRAEKISSMLLPLFFNAFKRADDLALAMDVRCYTGGEGRTSLREYKISLKDFIALILCIFFLLACRLDLLLKLAGD